MLTIGNTSFSWILRWLFRYLFFYLCSLRAFDRCDASQIATAIIFCYISGTTTGNANQQSGISWNSSRATLIWLKLSLITVEHVWSAVIGRLSSAMFCVRIWRIVCNIHAYKWINGFSIILICNAVEVKITNETDMLQS